MMAPVDPKNPASPKLKIPPSAATIQYPSPLGEGAMPTTGAAGLLRAFTPREAPPKGTTELGGGATATARFRFVDAAAGARIKAQQLPTTTRTSIVATSGNVR